MEKKTFSGKFEQINGTWYPVTVTAYNLQEANKMLYKGKRKTYGIVQEVKGRFKSN
jgi:hypothetical protein